MYPITSNLSGGLNSLKEVELLMESSQQPHPLAGSWCLGCDQRSCWARFFVIVVTVVIVIFMVIIIIIIIVIAIVMITISPEQDFLHLFTNLTASRSCFRQSPKEPSTVP